MSQITNIEELRIINFEKRKAKGEGVQIIRFFIGEYEFAIDIMDVKEIKEIDRIRNLPNSKAFVNGLFNLRGDIIPIFDLGKKIEYDGIEIAKLAQVGQYSQDYIHFDEKKEIDEEKNTIDQNDPLVKEFLKYQDTAEILDDDEKETMSSSDEGNSESLQELANDMDGISDESLMKAKMPQSLLICKVKNYVFGIIVDKISRVQYLTPEEYEPVPKLILFLGEQFIKGFAKVEETVLVILSLDSIFFLKK